MEAETAGSIEACLRAVAGGDERAAERLLPLVYDQLRELARCRLARLSPDQTLQPTALVHEAYLRLVGANDPGWNGRGHFFAAAAHAMRNILVDRARQKASLKYGGGRRRVNVEDLDLSVDPPGADILALHEAVAALEADDPRKGRIVNLRFFAGLTIDETAAALDISAGTVEREWRYIKSWLFKRLGEGGGA